MSPTIQTKSASQTTLRSRKTSLCNGKFEQSREQETCHQTTKQYNWSTNVGQLIKQHNQSNSNIKQPAVATGQERGWKAEGMKKRQEKKQGAGGEHCPTTGYTIWAWPPRQQLTSAINQTASCQSPPDQRRGQTWVGCSNKCNNALIQVKLSKVMIYYAKKATMNKN